MSVEFRMRRGASAVAAENNPVLGDGEPGWEKDTQTLKIGDGRTPWNDLDPFGAGTLDQLRDIEVAGVQDKQLLAYDAAQGVWVPYTPPDPYLDALQDVEVANVEDKQLLAYDAAQGVWVPYTPPAQNLDALQDVNISTVQPQDKNVLVYDAASGLWKPGKGEFEVGAWENDLKVDFSAGTALVSESTSPFSGTSYTAEPSVRVVVTEEMLASASRDDVGFVQQLELAVLLDASGYTGATGGTIWIQANYKGEQMASTINVNNTTGARFSATTWCRNVVVGDVVEVRFRYHTAGHSGVLVKAFSAACYPQGLFQKSPDEGGMYLYQSFVTGPALGLVTFPAAYPVTPNLLNYKLYDGQINTNASSSSPPEAVQRDRWVGLSPNGIYNSYQAHDTVAKLYQQSATAASSSPWLVQHLRCPSTVQFDRILLPPPPP